MALTGPKKNGAIVYTDDELEAGKTSLQGTRSPPLPLTV
jgi:hypothetical protein